MKLEIIGKACAAGSQIVQELVDGVIEHYAVGIQTISTIMDIQTIIVGGDIPQMDVHFYVKLQNSVNALQRNEESITILPSQLHSNNYLRGIGMLALQNIMGL